MLRDLGSLSYIDRGAVGNVDIHMLMGTVAGYSDLAKHVIPAGSRRTAP
jgi:hypothetical protein